MREGFLLAAALLLLLADVASAAGDLAALLADRAAVERVYYRHRLGDKPPFEQTTPPDLIRRLVQSDLHKEAVLKKAYGVEISPADLDAEARRIDSATRAPDVLAELKAALANDPARFARTVAKPILVERVLRERFENDDRLHAPQRRRIEDIRSRLIAARARGDSMANRLAWLKSGGANEVLETTWQLGARPQAGASGPDPAEEEIKSRFGPESQLLSSPRRRASQEKSWFADLPPKLQEVLRAQLLQPGDISAVIEMPAGFVVYLAEEKTGLTLKTAAVSVPKIAFEQWLDQQDRQGL